MKIFNEMIGKTLKEADGETFISVDGHKFEFFHEQDCCERVSVDEIHGDLADLIGSPIVQAEEVDGYCETKGGECEEWTFYKFATEHGSVTVRWYGDSNGYYSTSVSFRHTAPDGSENTRHEWDD